MTKATKKTFKKDLTTTPELNYNRDNKQKGDRPMTNKKNRLSHLKLKELKALAREKGIEVVGDRRKRETWYNAIRSNLTQFDSDALFRPAKFLAPDGTKIGYNWAHGTRFDGYSNYHINSANRFDREVIICRLAKAGFLPSDPARTHFTNSDTLNVITVH